MRGRRDYSAGADADRSPISAEITPPPEQAPGADDPAALPNVPASRGSTREIATALSIAVVLVAPFEPFAAEPVGPALPVVARDLREKLLEAASFWTARPADDLRPSRPSVRVSDQRQPLVALAQGGGRSAGRVLSAVSARHRGSSSDPAAKALIGAEELWTPRAVYGQNLQAHPPATPEPFNDAVRMR